MKTPGIRNSQTEKGLNVLKSKGIFNFADARKAGISQPTLSRLKADGIIERLAPGIYKHSEMELDSAHEEFAVGCMQFGPDAIVSGLSALFHYRILDEAPRHVWMLARPGKRSSDPKFVVIRTKGNLSKGVVIESYFKIASLERALVDAFRFSAKIGALTAVRATRQAIQEKKTTAIKVLKMSQELGVKQYILRHWEAIAPEHE